MADIFDFVLGPELNDAINGDYISDDLEFKVFIKNILDIVSPESGKYLMSVSCDLHNVLEEAIQEWAEKKDILEDYIDQI
jgi:hypothetical protein